MKMQVEIGSKAGISDAEFWAWLGQCRQNYTLTAGAMGEAHYWTESNASRTVASRDI